MIEAATASPAHEFFLDNGLKVVFVPAPGAPVATLMVLYHVGSRDEAVGYTGSSHLLEHMLFKGTPNNNRRLGRAFADMMNEIGASKNATTWIDRTNYFETVPAGYLEFAIELEADRMRNAFIADADRRSEMTVVRNELERSDNSPMRVLSAALVATAFREHPYHHPTIGWRPDVENVATERLRELYDTYYHPNNAAVFVVGDFEQSRTREAIERRFGALPRAPFAIPDVYTDEPPQVGERSLVIKRPGDTTLVGYAFHTPAALGQMRVLSRSELAERADAPRTEATVDGYALEVLARIVGRGRTSRLSRALVDSGLALDVSAWNWDSRDPGLFQIVVNVCPGRSADEVRSEVERVLATLAEHGPDPSEVERVQRQIVVQRAFARDGTYALASRLAEFEAVGGWRLDEDYVERVREVTPERVREVARAYVHDDNRTVGLLIPATAKTFDVVPFEAVAANPEQSAVVEAAPLPAPREFRDVPFAGRVAEGEFGALRWSYVATPENPTLHVRGLLEAGPALAGATPLLATLVADMLTRGTRRLRRQAIEERLERAGARRAYYVDDDPSQSYNPLAFRFTAACAADDAPLLLETLAEELAEPAFELTEFELVKAELVGALRLARTDTGWRAAQRFAQLAYEPGDPNAVPDAEISLAALEALTLDDARAFYERWVLRAQPLVTGAGALDERSFASLLERTLGTVPFRPAAPPVIEIRPRAARDAFERVELERKSNVDIVLGRAVSLVRSDPDFLAAHLANGILGQSTLSSRLGLRLRDREGLTYGVTSAFLSPGRLPGPWRVTVSVNPANVARAIASVRDVLRDYAEHGPTRRELELQRNSMAGQHHVRLATSAGIAGELERIAYYGLGPDYVDTYREQLEAVERDAVLDAARAYLGEAALIVSAAGTFQEAHA
jgi:zinc protease